MKTNKILIILGILLTFFSACNKPAETISDIEKLRQNTNKQGFPVAKMDSLQAIESITLQKLQEILDLSSLYHSGGDTEIDSVIYAQMKSYFSEPDSLKMNHLLKPIDSLKSKSAKISNLKIDKKIIQNDTLDFATFNIEYFDKSQKSLGKFENNAQFILKPHPIKFKKEFKFYFVDFNVVLPKDSTSSGVTR